MPIKRPIMSAMPPKRSPKHTLESDRHLFCNACGDKICDDTGKIALKFVTEARDPPPPKPIAPRLPKDRYYPDSDISPQLERERRRKYASETQALHDELNIALEFGFGRKNELYSIDLINMIKSYLKGVNIMAWEQSSGLFDFYKAEDRDRGEMFRKEHSDENGKFADPNGDGPTAGKMVLEVCGMHRHNLSKGACTCSTMVASKPTPNMQLPPTPPHIQYPPAADMAHSAVQQKVGMPPPLMMPNSVQEKLHTRSTPTATSPQIPNPQTMVRTPTGMASGFPPSPGLQQSMTPGMPHRQDPSQVSNGFQRRQESMNIPKTPGMAPQGLSATTPSRVGEAHLSLVAPQGHGHIINRSEQNTSWVGNPLMLTPSTSLPSSTMKQGKKRAFVDLTDDPSPFPTPSQKKARQIPPNPSTAITCNALHATSYNAPPLSAFQILGSQSTPITTTSNTLKLSDPPIPSPMLPLAMTSTPTPVTALHPFNAILPGEIPLSLTMTDGGLVRVRNVVFMEDGRVRRLDDGNITSYEDFVRVFNKSRASKGQSMHRMEW